MSAVELHERLRRYYTAYYRDVLGLPSWPSLVSLREQEERQEQERLARFRAIVGEAAVRGRILNLGCGTGGFNVAAAASGVCALGVDAAPDAIAICALRRTLGPGAYVQAAAESLPFRDGSFDAVYCYSVIEHVASVDATVREMVRVTRRGGVMYVHTPNAWSCYEGHYKMFWLPFLPRPLARLYLRARGRPTAYLATLRRLTPTALRRAFGRAGVHDVTEHAGAVARETAGRLRHVIALYYGLTGTLPYVELVARKP